MNGSPAYASRHGARTSSSGSVSGTVIVETIYNWPGLSSLLLAGVRSRDYPTVQGVVLVIAVLTILINLAIDLVYGLLDPRIRYA